MDYKKELELIEKDVNNKKLEQARLEERKKQLEEERVKILTTLKEENIEEDKLEDMITNLEIEITEQIEQCKTILNENS
jgi:hypothetical protein